MSGPSIEAEKKGSPRDSGVERPETARETAARTPPVPRPGPRPRASVLDPASRSTLRTRALPRPAMSFARLERQVRWMAQLLEANDLRSFRALIANPPDGAPVFYDAPGNTYGVPEAQTGEW